MSYEISVVVIQYNPSWEKLMCTLHSILQQVGCRYEIVIADDGSKEKFFDRTEAVFKAKKFNDYQIVDNIKNQGTVKNVLSGLRRAKGKYVRVIAPGDCLYSYDTLKKIVQFMEVNDAKEAFGKLAGYNYETGILNGFKVLIPAQTYLYEKNANKKQMLRSLLSYGDNISGASYSWERDFYIACLEKIENEVIYLEDCVNSYTILSGHRIYYMDEYVTWYEYGTGATTSGNKIWEEKILKDWESFFRVIKKEYPDSKYIKRAEMLHKMEASEDVFAKVLLRVLFFDKFVCLKLSRMRDKIEDKTTPDLEMLTYIHDYRA